MIWFIPTFSGDFRLEPADDGCKLTVVKPTTQEKDILDAFLAHARRAGWVAQGVGYDPDGKVSLKLTCSVREAGPVLVPRVLHRGDETVPLWTAVRSKADRVSLKVGKAWQDVPEDASAAVTLRRPNKGCPAPLRCNRRASEVLAAFCTAGQRASWETRGFFTVKGSLTRRPYAVFHADEAAARSLPRCLIDLQTREALCAWDDTVPAEEQALALKFMVEHQEADLLIPWMRTPL